MRTFLSLAALLFALPAPAFASDTSPATDTSPTSDTSPRGAAPSVFVIGDSHVEWLGPIMDRAVEDAGCTSLGHLARRGWSTRRYHREDDMAARIAEHGRPDIVVVSLGGNDRTRDPERYRAHLAWVVGQIREAGARRIIWLGPAASDVERSERARFVGEWHEANADAQRAILPELGVEWIDSRAFTRSGHGRDGIHFTYSAYRAWSAAVLQAAELLRVEPEADPNVVDRASIVV